MLKGILILAITSIWTGHVYAESRDTSFFYYQYNIPGYEFAGSHLVKTPGQADYFRIIFPPARGEELYNVQEFYENGKPKFTGKSIAGPGVRNNVVGFHGKCTSFFPSGNKRNIAYYAKGYKQGAEYEYFPDGKLYCTKRYLYTLQLQNVVLVDCYDTNGNMTAKGGYGRWVTYDAEFKNIIIEGTIKNGFRDGEWKGVTMDADSIRFTSLYKKNEFISGKSYDKAGNEYTFTRANVPPKYESGAGVFINLLRQRAALTKRTIRDTISVSFTIEKDGHLSDFAVMGHPNPALAAAVLEATRGCKNWEPRTYYGIPLRSRITVPLDFTNTVQASYRYGETILDVNVKPAPADE